MGAAQDGGGAWDLKGEIHGEEWEVEGIRGLRGTVCV